MGKEQREGERKTDREKKERKGGIERETCRASQTSERKCIELHLRASIKMKKGNENKRLKNKRQT